MSFIPHLYRSSLFHFNLFGFRRRSSKSDRLVGAPGPAVREQLRDRPHSVVAVLRLVHGLHEALSW